MDRLCMALKRGHILLLLDLPDADQRRCRRCTQVKPACMLRVQTSLARATRAHARACMLEVQTSRARATRAHARACMLDVQTSRARATRAHARACMLEVQTSRAQRETPSTHACTRPWTLDCACMRP
eukprot:366462-Chlamydomonas_euryale.AAC.13